jgi:D-3-phosphoglycerate dehydrogenase
MTDRNILILGKIDAAGTALLRARDGFTITELPDHAPERFAAASDADAVIVRMTPIDAGFLAAAPRLGIVSRHGVGYDTVDVAALTDRGAVLTITGDVNSGAVAEHTLACILALAKRILPYDRALRAGDFAVRDGFGAWELAGKTALIVGYGRIGRKVAALCRAFGMDVLVHDPFLPAGALDGKDVRAAPALGAALGVADVVSLHIPKTPETLHLIDADALGAMKPGAVLVNVSRGGLVDEGALCRALADGRLGGAALDVFEVEPPGPDAPMLAAANSVLTPHSAAFTAECAARMAIASAQNVIDFFDGRLDPGVVINPEAADPRG